jgi:regulator of protease activity HflC (stomatin/prohibitin superfamily)
MSTIAWIILLILLIPAIGILIWVIIAESLVRVPSGSLGLVMVKGRATDTVLLPGPHFVPALRRRMVEEYPSVEMAYRAGAQPDTETTALGTRDAADESGVLRRSQNLERTGPPLEIALGDRSTATVSLTIRFRLIAEQLRRVHERFGPHGVFGIVRDESIRAAAGTLGDPSFGVDSLFGPAREACQYKLLEEIGAALEADGIEVTAVVLGTVDLGRTGEVIQATVRARYELEREQAEAATRLVRAMNDADLQDKMSAPSEGAWRYRETDLWRDLVQRTAALNVALRAGPGSPVTGVGTQGLDPATLAADQAALADQAHQQGDQGTPS